MVQDKKASAPRNAGEQGKEVRDPPGRDEEQGGRKGPGARGTGWWGRKETGWASKTPFPGAPGGEGSLFSPHLADEADDLAPEPGGVEGAQVPAVQGHCARRGVIEALQQGSHGGLSWDVGLGEWGSQGGGSTE